MSKLNTTSTEKNIAIIQTKLAHNLHYITDITAGLTDNQCHHKPFQDEWSLIEVLAHLRSSADLNHFKIYAMLATNTPIIPAIHPRLEWQKIVPYTQIAYSKSLMAYSLQREELLTTLRSIHADDWKRTGTWDNRTYSVYLVARSMALHEEEHFEQIDNLVNQIKLV